MKGDLHDIGKNLVASLLEGGGFEVIDLGADVPPEKFIEAVREQGVQIVCLSALLTVTMPSMKSTIEALKQAGVRDRVKVLVVVRRSPSSTPARSVPTAMARAQQRGRPGAADVRRRLD